MTAAPLWECPDCGRQFPKKRQWHSCGTFNVEDHFRQRPAALRRLFDRLLEETERFGPVRTDPVRNSINLASRYHFAVVYVLKESMKLEFLLNRELHDPRIERTIRLGEDSYSHFVKVRSEEEIDDQLLNWLSEAYHLKS